MKANCRAQLCLCIFLLCAPVQQAAARQEHDHPAPEKLGTLSFPVSCSARVQKPFERAVALLHSFAYADAEKAFREVAAADPDCAMAHWGVAMTYFHELWEPRIAPNALARGRTEIERAGQLAAGSERERQFIEALGLVYRDADSVPYRTRSLKYEAAMSQLAARNPQDTECQIFYALALISTALPTDKDHINQKKASGILEPLFRKYPDHPGIAHYLIHAYDSPELAAKGIAAARAYSQIAPSAPHALHMPSHIFTQLGMWEDSVRSNLAARASAHEHGDIGEELHAMDYITYAYLQLGRDAEAARVLKELREMPELQGADFKVGYAASAMPVRYAIERRQWTEAAQLSPIPGTGPEVVAITLWARAVGLARSGNPAAARPEIKKLKDAYERLRALGKDYWAAQVHVQIREASAWAAHAEGKQEDAVSLMRAAAEEEDSTEKLPVTPGAIVPAREQLGDLLLELKRPKEALEAFRLSLTTAPQRRGSLSGAIRATEMAGGRSAVK